jgi:uncharacterized membrane protein YhaH (DUF805 family)
MNLCKLLLSPQGRIGRQTYWVCVFLAACALAATATLDIFVFGVTSGNGPVFTLVGLAGVYPAICVQSKRLHDLGRSAWFLLAPYGLSAATMSPVGEDLAQLLSFAMLSVSFAFMIWLGFFGGQPGPNKHGEPGSGDRDLGSPAETFS